MKKKQLFLVISIRLSDMCASGSSSVCPARRDKDQSVRQQVFGTRLKIHGIYADNVR